MDFFKNRLVRIGGVAFFFFAMGNVNFWIFQRAEKDNWQRRDISPDAKTFTKMSINASRNLVAALNAEKQRNYEEAERQYDRAFEGYRKLEVSAYYKKCCVMFAQKKYSAALDELLVLLKGDPEIGKWFLYTGCWFASMVYVCLYEESGPDEAKEWVMEMEAQLDEKGKRFLSALVHRSTNDCSSVSNRLFSASEQKQLQMFVRHLDEIDRGRNEK